MAFNFLHLDKGFDGVTQSVSQLPYHADQQSIGQVAHWTADKLCHLVDDYTPSKYKNAAFGSFFHTITLISSRYFGSRDVKNVDKLRARVWLQKPLEFLRGSRIWTARRIYDSIAQNYHAEKHIPEVVDKICKQSLNHYNKTEDPTNPGQILKGKLQTLITKLVQGSPTTWAQAASKVSEAALPEAIEQGLRIFLVTGLWSLYTNSPFLSTLGTVCTLTAAVDQIGNMPSGIQIYAHVGAVAPILFFSSNAQWLSTIPSVCTLAVWWGLIANGRTAELAGYKPPESANKVEYLVRDNISGILDEIENVLDSNHAIGRKGLDKALENIKFPAYPFESFAQKGGSHNSEKHVTIEHLETKEEKKPKRLPFQDLEDATKKFEKENSNYKENPRYWELQNAEYRSKLEYYESIKEWNKYVTCIIRIENAFLEYHNLAASIEKYENAKEKSIDRVNKKLAMSKLAGDKRLLKFIEDVKTYKHKDDA